MRIVLALLAAAVLGGGGSLVIGRALEPEPDTSGQWFAPYVDLTLPPFFDFQDAAANPSADVVLSFVVADFDDGCRPSWGGAFSLDEAATALDLDRRIVRMRQRGGDVVVSFGGASNEELAVACTDDRSLSEAYRSVIDRYEITTLDFDIEGPALTDVAAHQRRAAAVATVQGEARQAGRPLAVWLTLPVAPAGIPAEGVSVIDAMLEASVDLAGVNVMTMNYGQSRAPDTSMVDASLEALDAAHRQLDGAYRRAGMLLDRNQLWSKLGVTPMIGQNDVLAERVTVDDARRLFAAARERGVGRFGLWSLNRDRQCGGNVDAAIVNNACSGVKQEPGEFAALLRGLQGRPAGAADQRTIANLTPVTVDDPDRSPYPVWRDRREYEEGAKVVWRGMVYQAKWWNSRAAPDAPVTNEWDSPWRIVGPVLEEDLVAPVTTTTIPPGTFPAWSRTEVYDAGDRVEWRGTGYEAKWWTRGAVPDVDVDNDWETPWRRIDRVDP